MLDLRTEKILEYLKDLCPSNGYSVLSIGEVASYLADSEDVSLEEVEKGLLYLSYEGYINMRFCEGGEFCFSMLPKGRAYVKVTVRETTKEREIRWNILRQALPPFLGSLIGGFIVGMIGRC